MEPKIRLKGFSGDWNESKLNSFLTPSTSKNRDGKFTKEDVLSVSGEYGIVNQIALKGRSFAGVSVLNYGVVENKDIVYTKSPLRTNPYGIIKANEGVAGIVSTLYAIYKSSELTDSTFVQYYFELDSRLNSYLRPLVRKGAKNDMNVSAKDALLGNVRFPSYEEEQAIAEFFKQLDSLIQSTTKKIESLKQVKAASLQSMFPQKGETTPRVRFKGFGGEWEETLLGTVFSERCEYSPSAEMLSVTMNQGVIKASDNGRIDNSNSDKSKYKLVKIDDIAYNSMRMWQGACGCSKYEGIVSPAYTVIAPKGDICSSFFSYMFKTNRMLRVFRLNSQGLTSDTWNLKYPAFSKLSVVYPKNIGEQHAIADYFTNLDSQISLQTQRLEKLKQIKSACLDNMFV